ncbi:oxidoreductase [Lapidilactobacillus salsurivasis]
MKLTMAIAGFGKSANRYHLPYLALRPEIKVKTIYDHGFRHYPEAQQAWREQGVTLTKDFQQVLTDPEIQLITLTTPAATHYQLAKEALDHGKNVLVEKPFCQTKAEAAELLALARRKGLVAMPFQNRRFDGDFLVLQRVLQVGYLGRPLEVESHMDHYRLQATQVNGAMINGQFYGLGVHTLDQMVALFGTPKQAYFDIRPQQNQGDLDDYYEVDLFYEGFKAKVKSSNLVATPYPKFLLHGTQGSFLKYGIDQQENDLKAQIMPGTAGFGQDDPSAYGRLHYQNSNGDWIDKSLPTPTGDYGRVYDAMMASIITGAPKLVSDQELLTVMALLEAGAASAGPHVVTL